MWSSRGRRKSPSSSSLQPCCSGRPPGQVGVWPGGGAVQLGEAVQPAVVDVGVPVGGGRPAAPDPAGSSNPALPGAASGRPPTGSPRPAGGPAALGTRRPHPAPGGGAACHGAAPASPAPRATGPGRGGGCRVGLRTPGPGFPTACADPRSAAPSARPARPSRSGSPLRRRAAGVEPQRTRRSGSGAGPRPPRPSGRRTAPSAPPKLGYRPTGMGLADLVGDHVLGALVHHPGPLRRAIQDLDQRHPMIVLRPIWIRLRQPRAHPGCRHRGTLLTGTAGNTLRYTSIRLLCTEGGRGASWHS